MANTDAYSNKQADNIRLAASRLMIAPSDATYNLIRLPKFAFVTNVWVQIVTAFTLDASIEVGWAGNGETAVVDGFITDDLSDPTVVGVKSGFNATTRTFPAKYFSAAGGVITATVADNSGAVNNFRVFAQYSVIYP
jgi:hypothetical protein